MRVVILKEYAKKNFPATPLLDYAIEVEKITTSKVIVFKNQEETRGRTPSFQTPCRNCAVNIVNNLSYVICIPIKPAYLNVNRDFKLEFSIEVLNVIVHRHLNHE